MMEDYLVPELSISELNGGNDVFRKLHGEEILSLKQEIEEIREQIKERERLSQEVTKSCEDIKTQLENVINEFRSVIPMGGPVSSDTSALGALIRLREQQAMMDQFSVKERMESWKDIALLKKELREIVKEFKERESRVDMLDKILVE